MAQSTKGSGRYFFIFSEKKAIGVKLITFFFWMYVHQIAADYAAKLLQQARKRVQGDKACFVEADLTKNKSTAIKVDVSFCINALTHSVAKKKKRIADFGAVATKHYLHYFFAQLLEKVGFQVECVDRVEL